MKYIYYFQVNGGLENVYVLSNCAYNSHNILNL